MSTPAVARPAPTIAATRTLGSRINHTMASSARVIVVISIQPAGRSLAASACTTADQSSDVLPTTTPPTAARRSTGTTLR
jgi:hypothetical protein